MYDLNYSQDQREKALKDYYVNGKKREMMIVGNKVAFGFKFVANFNDSLKNHFIKGNKKQKMTGNA